MSLATFAESLWVAFKREFARELAPYLPPKTPRRPSIQLLREEPGNMLIYGLTLPAPTAADVASWELKQVVNGTETIVPATDGQELSFTQGDTVSLSVREVDDAGNQSGWSPSLDFTAADTIPPSDPGAPVVSLLREEG